MKFANIVYENELVNHTEVDYVNYYKGLTEYDKLDKRLPTLYVGWSFMKASNPDNQIIQNADILKKKIITNTLYWECSYEESKMSHVKGVSNFISYIPQFYFTPKYQYINLDPVFFQIKDIDDLMDALPKTIDRSYNYKNEMLYLYFSDNTAFKIAGINLKMYEFFKFDSPSIILRISGRTKSSIIDIDGSYYQKFYKIFPNFTLLKRYIVTI